MISLALRSLWFRRGSLAITVISIAFSVALLLGIERVRTQAKENFAGMVSGTDLIVSARGNPVQILLASIMHIGYPASGLTQDTVQTVCSNRNVAWCIPIAMGDSHRGYRVVGTDLVMFDKFRYARNVGLSFREGRRFTEVSSAVVGSQVAESLGYRVGSKIVVTHGAGGESLIEHAAEPFTVSGVLAPTGTPVDRAIYVSMEGYEAMHEGFGGHANIDPLVDPDHAEEKSVSAVLVGLKSRAAVLGVQRSFNEYRREALTAVMPGDTLLELWQLTGIAETALVWISGVVVLIGLVGITANLLASVNERRREMAVLRAIGAGLPQVTGLILGEAILLTTVGVVVGLVLFQVAMFGLAPMLRARYGFEIAAGGVLPGEWIRLGWILLAGGLVGAFPAYRTYKRSLSDGISIRV